MKRYVFISLILNFLLLSIAGALLSGKFVRKFPDRKATNKSLSDQEIKNRLDDNPGITFLGNSLTAYADWRQLLKRDDVNVCGITDFTSQQLSWVLDWCVCSKPPQICFINGGQEDVFLNIPVTRVIKNYKMIASRLKKVNVTPVIQSTLQLSGFVEYNEKIRRINDGLKELCIEEHIDFIDIENALCHENGLRPEFTTDGMHLNDEGYVAWAELITAYLDRINK